MITSSNILWIVIPVFFIFLNGMVAHIVPMMSSRCAGAMRVCVLEL